MEAGSPGNAGFFITCPPFLAAAWGRLLCHRVACVAESQAALPSSLYPLALRPLTDTRILFLLTLQTTTG